MEFAALPIQGAFQICLTPHRDERGYFARIFCQEQFAQYGLVSNFVQASTAYNTHQGQVRGMHYQLAPHTETKLVRCTQGCVLDVLLDLREHSPTYRMWFGLELEAASGNMVYIPKGVAHGYMTLRPECVLDYMMDTPYHATSARECEHEALIRYCQQVVSQPVS